MTAAAGRVPAAALHAWRSGDHGRVIAALRADGYDVPSSVAAIEAAVSAAKKRDQDAVRQMRLHRDTGTGWPS